MSGKRHYEIFLDDAFAWLARRKKNSIHAVVMDPPYGLIEYEADQLEKRNNGRGGIWRLPRCHDGSMRQPSPRFTVLGAGERHAILSFHTRLATLLIRPLVPGAHVFIAAHPLLSHLVCWAFVSAGFEKRGEIVRTVRTLRGGDRPKLAEDEFPDVSVLPRSCWEPWCLFRKPLEGRVQDNLRKWGTGALRRPTKNGPFPDIIESGRTPVAERRIAPHPSLKPQHFLRQLVHAALPLGKGVILDPFMGSGSTLAAAESHGLRSIGIEINAEFFELAKAAIPALADFEVAGIPLMPAGRGQTRGRCERSASDRGTVATERVAAVAPSLPCPQKTRQPAVGQAAERIPRRSPRHQTGRF
jgi:hypothetical protein